MYRINEQANVMVNTNSRTEIISTTVIVGAVVHTHVVNNDYANDVPIGSRDTQY